MDTTAYNASKQKIIGIQKCMRPSGSTPISPSPFDGMTRRLRGKSTSKDSNHACIDFTVCSRIFPFFLSICHHLDPSPHLRGIFRSKTPPSTVLMWFAFFVFISFVSCFLVHESTIWFLVFYWFIFFVSPFFCPWRLFIPGLQSCTNWRCANTPQFIGFVLKGFVGNSRN